MAIFYHQGLLGSIGDFLGEIEWHNEKWGMRMFWDLAFFVLITVCMLNIVFGIMVDTFAELRTAKEELQSIMNNRCFICGMSRYELDQKTSDEHAGFKQHIRDEHHLWMYLYYIVHIRITDPCDYNGVETFVSNMCKAEKQSRISWFPLHRALCINDGKGETDQITDSVLPQLDSLHKSVANLQKAVKTSNDLKAKSKAGQDAK